MNGDRLSLRVTNGLDAGEPIVDRWVDRTEFGRLAVSNRKLLRMDDHEADLMGLFDPHLRIRFVTPRSPYGNAAVKAR
jgi:hypothetical protein